MHKNRMFYGLLLFLGIASIGNTQSVAINEFMADNGELTQIVDEVGQADDWIELYNTTNETIDLSGYFLSDKLDDLEKWEIPEGTTIAPTWYKIFWADDDASQGPLHTNFKLSKTGESIYLTRPNGEIEDSITYQEQTTNISFARIPNGTGDFIFKAPTFGYDNESLSGIKTPVNKAAFSIFPNPAVDFFTINWKESGTENKLQISVWNALGQLVHTEALTRTGAESKTTVSSQQYASGLYYVQLETETYHSIELLLVD